MYISCKVTAPVSCVLIVYVRFIQGHSFTAACRLIMKQHLHSYKRSSLYIMFFFLFQIECLSFISNEMVDGA